MSVYWAKTIFESIYSILIFYLITSSTITKTMRAIVNEEIYLKQGLENLQQY